MECANRALLTKKLLSFPDFAQFLVEQGIDSISVTPDSVIKTVKAIHAIEQKQHKAAAVMQEP